MKKYYPYGVLDYHDPSSIINVETAVWLGLTA